MKRNEAIEIVDKGEASNESISIAFHYLWTKASGLAAYDKGEWAALQILLNSRGILV